MVKSNENPVAESKPSETKEKKSAFLQKLEAASGLIDTENNNLQSVIERLDNVALVAADMLVHTYGFGVGAADILSSEKIFEVAAEVKDGFSELFELACRKALQIKNVKVSDVFGKDATESGSPATIAGFLGTVFSNIVIISEEKLNVAGAVVSVDATARLTAVRKEILRRFAMSGLETETLLVNLSKTVLSFTTRVISSLQSAVASAYSVSPVDAQDEVLKVLDAVSLSESILTVLKGPVGKVAHHKFSFN